MGAISSWQWNCPVEVSPASPRITLPHGEGARLTRRLITETILPRFGTPPFVLSDAAHVVAGGNRLALTSDCHTVSPLFFPGGDLGSLSVYGTVNDLAVSGAVPRWLTCGLIIEEGLPLSVLERILDSAAEAARRCRVTIVAGDTKVVPRGAADGLYLITAGVGELTDPVPTGPPSIRPGDCLIVSGPVGRHGIAVLCARNDLGFDPAPASDSGPVLDQVSSLRLSAGTQLRAIRDATRGGISAVLHEWAIDSGLTFALQDTDIPVTDDVRGACELLGLDPLYVASEGTIVAAVAPECSARALRELQKLEACAAAAIIGTAEPRGISPVTIRRAFGSEQPLDEPSGAPLIRIC